MQQLLKSLLGQFGKGGGNQANLQGLVSQLQGGGLGDQVQTWLKQGPNEAVSGKQIQEALGTGTLDQVAAKAGLPPEKAADDLASMLPALVDTASPQGKLPSAPAGQADLDTALQQLLSGLSRKP